MLRQPVGVCATIAPFNFPGMIPFWYLPYALATGNTYIVKPSEKVPMTMQLIFQLIEQLGLPEGRGQPGAMAPRKRWMRSSIIRSFARSPLSARSQRARIYLQPRGGERQACPGAGRGQESGRRPAGCGHGDGDQDHRRFGLWLRRSALPGRLVGGDGGRGAQPVQ